MIPLRALYSTPQYNPVRHYIETESPGALRHIQEIGVIKENSTGALPPSSICVRFIAGAVWRRICSPVAIGTGLKTMRTFS